MVEWSGWIHFRLCYCDAKNHHNAFKYKEDKNITKDDGSLVDKDIIEESLSCIPDKDKAVRDEILELDAITAPTEEQAKILSDTAHLHATRMRKKMEKISVAPGESGKFQNWGEDIFLEERMFPDKFPYGTGGYLSTCMDNPEKNLGFAAYCVNQIMSCDEKFRNDSIYLFFLLLVKELIMLKRCKTTYLRQATKIPNLNKSHVLNQKHENLGRYNRSFEVFKTMRGTSMYYEESKKNLMAIMRQKGCPSLFFTLSMAEFDWPELLQEIIETVYRQKVTREQVEDLSPTQKNKLITENYVQSTLHFQKRIEKFFSLMKYDNFFSNSGDKRYHVSSYFYRVEFQQRGAPHVHSLLWLKDNNGNDATTFWEEDTKDCSNGDKKDEKFEKRKKEIEEFADLLISTSPTDIKCDKHSQESVNMESCPDCQLLIDKVSKYQKHGHTFTCKKKSKTISIKSNVGHGIDDGIKEGPELYNIPLCRFNFPKYPSDKTKFILGVEKDLDEKLLFSRRKDLKKITKYLIRQTLRSLKNGKQ